VSTTGWLGRFRHWLRSAEDAEAEELQEISRDRSATAVRDAPHAAQVTVAGTLRTVTLRPRVGVPALEAELFDGTGVVQLVWLGRRVIRGITPGRTMVAHGRVTRRGDRLMMYNPSYELLETGA
jgi:RecG-like helicase